MKIISFKVTEKVQDIDFCKNELALSEKLFIDIVGEAEEIGWMQLQEILNTLFGCGKHNKDDIVVDSLEKQKSRLF